jgi:hypothetical protein
MPLLFIQASNCSTSCSHETNLDSSLHPMTFQNMKVSLGSVVMRASIVRSFVVFSISRQLYSELTDITLWDPSTTSFVLGKPPQ